MKWIYFLALFSSHNLFYNASDIRACRGHCQEMAAKNKNMKKQRLHFLVMVMVRFDGGLSEGEFVSLQCLTPPPI